MFLLFNIFSAPANFIPFAGLKKNMIFLERPGLEHALGHVSKAIRESRFFIAVGSCTVCYSGRAKACLAEGERVFMVKEDRSVTVHKKDRHAPVNYQTAGCKLSSSLEGGRLRILSSKKSERLEVSFSSVHFLGVFDLKDNAELSLLGREKDLSRLVKVEPFIIEDGLVPIEMEKGVRSGAIDVYARDREGNIVLVELKRRTVGLDDVSQLGRYVREVRRIKRERVRGIICAPSITPNARELLAGENLEFLELDPSLEHLEEGRIRLERGQKRILEY